MSLSPRQQRFVEEYLVDLNAKQAAIRAGYSPNGAEVQGFRLLSNANVQTAIAEAQQARAKRTLITADMVIKGLLSEAQLVGDGSSHSARVSAWTQLGKHLGLFVDRTRYEGGVTMEIVEELVDAGPSAHHPTTPGAAGVSPV